MAIKPLPDHYSMENHATIYDEEALTALQLAARTTGKVNEVAEEQNNLREEVGRRLDEHEEAVGRRLDKQENERIPASVRLEVQRHIDDGSFDGAIDEYAGGVESKINNDIANHKALMENELTKVRARVADLIAHNNDTDNNSELVDLRTIGDRTYPSAGEAVRQQLNKKLPFDNVFTQVYIDGGVIREIEYPTDSTDILVVIDRSIIVRVYNTTSLAPDAFMANLGGGYTATTTSGKTAIRIPSSHNLVLLKDSPIRVSIIERTTVDPLNTINLIENVSGYVVGGAFMHYFHEYNLKNNKSDLTKMKVVDAEQIYLTEEQCLSHFETNGSDVWFAFKYQIAGRVGVSFTHSFETIGATLGEYFETSPNGVKAIKIPSVHSFVFDRNAASSGYYRIIPRESFDPITQFMIADNVSGTIIRGAFKWYFDKWISERYAKTLLGDVTSVDADSSFAANVMSKRNKNTVSFLWASDTHVGIEHNYGCGIDILRRYARLSNSCKTDFMAITGDIMHGYWDVESQKRNLCETVNHLYDKTPVMLCMGNHDDNTWYANGTASNATPTGLSQVLTPETFYAMSINRNDSGVVVDPENPFGGWYYKDFPEAKIRAIFLNSSDMTYIENDDKTLKYSGMQTFGYREAQLKWVANTALNMPADGWGVIFFEHGEWSTTYEREYFINDALMSQLLTAYQNGTNTTLNGYHPNFLVNFTTAFGDHRAELIAHFSGHTHKDRVYNDIMQHITIVDPLDENGGGCDLVTIDRTTRTITNQRYADKPLVDYDRVTNY